MSKLILSSAEFVGRYLCIVIESRVCVGPDGWVACRALGPLQGWLENVILSFKCYTRMIIFSVEGKSF